MSRVTNEKEELIYQIASKINDTTKAAAGPMQSTIADLEAQLEANPELADPLEGLISGMKAGTPSDEPPQKLLDFVTNIVGDSLDHIDERIGDDLDKVIADTESNTASIIALSS